MEKLQTSCVASYLNESQQVQLKVYNESQLIRKNVMVSNGLPIPRDFKLANVNDLKLVNEKGQLISAQFRTLAWWPEGTIKWVLISFLVTVKPKQTKKYFLDFSAKGRQTSLPPTIGEENDSYLKVNTGTLKFVVDKESKNLIDNLYFKNAQGWANINTENHYFGPIVDTGKQKLHLGSVERLLVNDNGNEKIDLTINGKYVTEERATTGLSYIVRLIAYRGSSAIKFFHTLRNEGSSIKLNELTFNIPVKAQKVEICEEGKTIFQKRLSKDSTSVSILQDNLNSFEKRIIKDKYTETNGQFSGWITVFNNKDLAVSATIRHFWQKYPKALMVSKDTLRIGLLPGESKNFDSFKPGGQIKDSYELLQGESRTHEFMLHFHETDVGIDDIAMLMDDFNNPLYCLASWGWYAESGVLGDLSCVDLDRFPEYEKGIVESFAGILEKRKKLQLYGDRNFGDDSYRDLGAWNNGEYDYPHVGMLMFLRGGGQIWYDQFALPAARHMVDVDIINAGSQKGMVYQHDNDKSCEVLGHSSQGRGKLGSHAWTQGILEYYAFSGDFLARDVALSVANRWANETLEKYERVKAGDLLVEKMYPTERTWGWTNLGLMGAYNIIPKKRYLQAADSLIKVAQELQMDNGLLGGFFERHGFAGILMGSPIMDSIVMYYQATQKEEIKDLIISLGRALSKYGWVEPPGAWAYHANHKDYRTSSDRNLAPAVAYAYHYSDTKEKDALLWERAKRGFKRSWEDSAKDGKGITQAHRFALRMIALLSIYS